MKAVMSLLFVASLSVHADEWSDWDQLPDDLLGLSGSDNIEQLMERLDALIAEQAPIADIDSLLDHWLRQPGGAELGRSNALQHLMRQHPHLSDEHPALDVLQDLPGPALDQNRPNRPGSSGPPSGPPAGPPSGTPGNTNR